jgi:hypothetical protein
LLHACHSFCDFNSSFRTYARPTAKGSMLPGGARPSKSSQPGHEIQPSSRYVWDGSDGMSEGR